MIIAALCGCSTTKTVQPTSLEQAGWSAIALVQASSQDDSTETRVLQALDREGIHAGAMSSIGTAEIYVLCARAEEAVRIIGTLGIPPRRLIVTYPIYPKITSHFAFPTDGPPGPHASISSIEEIAGIAEAKMRGNDAYAQIAAMIADVKTGHFIDEVEKIQRYRDSSRHEDSLADRLVDDVREHVFQLSR